MALHRCDCEHQGQDKLNGKKIRVYNQHDKKKTTDGKHWHSCTVCGKQVVI